MPALLALAGLVLFRAVRPDFRATLLVISDAPLPEIELTYEGERIPPTLRTDKPQTILVWEGLKPRSTRPRLLIEWVAADGTHRQANQVMLHFPDWPRCFYLLRLDARAEPIPIQTIRRHVRSDATEICPGEPDNPNYD